MQQLKLFKGVENDLASLENDVNSWIRQTGAKIVSITGNIAPQSEMADASGGTSLSKTYPPSDVIIIVLYVPRKKPPSQTPS